MKGIILAGGSGTRLYPLTLVTSKQLLPIYDKPMIYYPISTLMLANIRDILIICTPNDIDKFRCLLGDGTQFGIKLTYAIQEKPEGLAQAFIIGEDFISDEPCAMVLGDNIFYGSFFKEHLKKAKENIINGYTTIFGYHVKDPKRFGIVEFDENKNVISLEEKPENPKSSYCVTGLYFYPKGVSEYAKELIPSARGELEITDLNNLYLKENKLKVQILGRGFAWMDTGTIDSLLESASFIQNIQTHQDVVISSLEEIAFNSNWISKEQLLLAAKKYGKSQYGEHLLNVANKKLVY